MPFSLRIRRNDIPRVQASITDKSVDAVRENAHNMRDFAQRIAPVDTGAFRASLYVNGPEGESDYIQAAAGTLARRPKARIVPEQHAATVDTGVSQLRNSLGQFSLPEAIVSSAVDYAVMLEEGTVYMSPRPTFMNAALATQPDFITAMRRVADNW